MAFTIWPINELFRFSGNRLLGVEGKKVVVLEKYIYIYISMKQPELDKFRQTVLLK